MVHSRKIFNKIGQVDSPKESGHMDIRTYGHMGAFHLETRPFFGLQSVSNNWLLFCLYLGEDIA